MGNVSAGTGGVVMLNNVQGSEVTGSLGGDGTVRVPSARTVDFTNNGAASTGTPKLDIVRGGTTRFTPGAAGTFAGAVVTSIANEGLLHATNGVTDLSGATMTTTNIPGLQPGLFGGRVATAANIVDFPNANSGTSGMDLALSRAQTTDNGFFGGDNGTWVYSGEIKIPDTDGDGTPGPVAFGEQFDDFALLKIDGARQSTTTPGTPLPVRASSSWSIRNRTEWVPRATVGSRSRHALVIRRRRRPGQLAGTSASASTPILPTASTCKANRLMIPPLYPAPIATVTQYVEPFDNGTMNLFRASPDMGHIRVINRRDVEVGSVVGSNVVDIAENSVMQLNGAGTSKINASTLDLAGTPAAPTGTLDVTNSAIVLDYPTGGPTADRSRRRAVADHRRPRRSGIGQDLERLGHHQQHGGGRGCELHGGRLRGQRPICRWVRTPRSAVNRSILRRS